MNDGQSTTHPEPDPAPFKVHLLTRAGRVMRARSEPVRAFSNKDEAIRFAGRQLGGDYAVYHKHKKIWPAPNGKFAVRLGSRAFEAPRAERDDVKAYKTIYNLCLAGKLPGQREERKPELPKVRF